MRAPYEMFGQTRNVEVEVYRNGRRIEGDDYEESVWIERSEDWYGFQAPSMKDKRIRVITPQLWRRGI